VFDGGTTRGIYHIVHIGISDWLTGQINALEFDSMVRWCWQKGHIGYDTCMQAYAG
jgi:hypothetical protein